MEGKHTHTLVRYIILVCLLWVKRNCIWSCWNCCKRNSSSS